MRVTNSMLVSSFNKNLNTNMNALNKLSIQIARNKTYANISDDPVAVIFAQQARYNIQRVADYQQNVGLARDWNKQTEDALYELNKIIADAYTACMDASNEAKTAEDKKLIADAVKEMRDHLLMTLNSTFGNKYVFGAYNTVGYPNEPPFEVIDGKLHFNKVDLTARVYSFTAIAGDIPYNKNDIGFAQEIDPATGSPVPGSEGASFTITDQRKFQSALMGASSLNVRFADAGDGNLAITVGTQTLTIDDPSRLNAPIEFKEMGLSIDFSGTDLSAVMGDMKLGSPFSAAGGDIDGAEVKIIDPSAYEFKRATTTYPDSFGVTIKPGVVDGKHVLNITLGGVTVTVTADEIKKGPIRFEELGPNGEVLNSMGLSIDFSGFEGEPAGTNTVWDWAVNDGATAFTPTPVTDPDDPNDPGFSRVSIFSEEVKKLPSNSRFDISSEPGTLSAAERAAIAASDPTDPRLAEDKAIRDVYARLAGESLKFDVAPGVEMQAAMNGLAVALFGPGGYNLYNLLDDLYTAMDTGMGAEKLNFYINGLQDAQNHVLSMEAEIGGRQLRLNMLENRYAQDELNYVEILTRVEVADLAELAMREKMAQAVYKAALQSGAYIIQPTLMDFLR